MEEDKVIEYKKTKRKINAARIAEVAGLGTMLAGFGASQLGAFDNMDLSNVGEFASNVGNKILEFYRGIMERCNPGNSFPSYVFLTLAAGFIVLIIRNRIKAARNAKRTVNELGDDVESLTAENEELKAKVMRKKPSTPSAPTAPIA